MLSKFTSNLGLPFFTDSYTRGNTKGHRAFGSSSLICYPVILSERTEILVSRNSLTACSPLCFHAEDPHFCTSPSRTLLSSTSRTLCYLDVSVSFTKINLDQIFTLLLPNIKNHYPPRANVHVRAHVRLRKHITSSLVLPFQSTVTHLPSAHNVPGTELRASYALPAQTSQRSYEIGPSSALTVG